MSPALAPPRPDELDAMFAALADPTRREIVARLSHGDATLTDLAQPFPMSLQAVSQHLGVLERAGPVEARRSQARAAQSVNVDLFDRANMVAAWGERLARIKRFAQAAAAQRNRGG